MKTKAILAIMAIALLSLSAFTPALAVSTVSNEEKQFKKEIIKALESDDLTPETKEVSLTENLESGAILCEEIITIDGIEYKKEAYEIKVDSGDYDKTSYIIFRRNDREPLINVFLVPGDNMLGEYAFAYPFSESLTKNIIDGTVANKDLEFINLISKLTDGKVGIVVVNKVRAAYVPAGLTDYSFTGNWNLKTYESDFEEIVADANARTGVEIYLTAGHSRGAEVIQLHGEHPLGILMATIPLDMVGEYRPGSQEYQNSLITLDALEDYMAEGNYVSDISGLFMVLNLAQYYPENPSPIPEFEGMTNMQVALFMLENTGILPGPLTSVTGLPDSWYLDAYCTGDLESLYYTDINRLFEILNAGGFYPITPLAVEKQSMEKRTHGGIDGSGLSIDFESWKNLYISINAKSGFKLDKYTNTLIPSRFSIFKEIVGGHLDLLWQIL